MNPALPLAHAPSKSVVGFLGFLWVALSLNLFLAVARFQTDVLNWDQWDFFNPLFNGGGMWDLFRYQHGPHRQGLSFVFTSWVLDATRWDTRWDSLWIASLLSLAGLLALRLKWRLTGILGFRDGWIPLLVLGLGQFETLLVVPNASHSAFPIALILLTANLWLSANLTFRYPAAGVCAVGLTFTGFGLFAGAVLSVLLLVAIVRHSLARELPAALAAGVGFTAAAVGWIVFRSDYAFSPAVADFRFPWQPVTDYFRFIALMLLQPAGVRSGAGADNYLFGTMLALVVVAAAVFLGWQWLRTRKPSPSIEVMILLLGAGVLFVCNTAVGRISLGITAGMSSRYVTLMLPLWLAIYFAAATAGRKNLYTALTLLLWCMALWPCRDLVHRPVGLWPGTLGATADQAALIQASAVEKSTWVETYLKTNNAVSTQQSTGILLYPSPEATHMDDKLRFLREHRLSFFADLSSPHGYRPWLAGAPPAPDRPSASSRPPRPPPGNRDPAVNPSAVLLLAAWLSVALVIAGPGLAAHLWLGARGVSDERLLLIGPLVVVGLLGYLGFFVFFANATAGKGFAIAVTGAAWAFALRLFRRGARPARPAAAVPPLLLGIGLSLFYLALLYLPALGQPFARQSALRWISDLPADALLPQRLGDRLYAGASLPAFAADCLGSAVQPLQAGLYLLVLPWLRIARVPDGLGYQCVGTLAQLVWVPAVWLLGRTLGRTARRSALAGLIVGTLGFFLLNSVFVWPKLLAAASVILAAVLLLDKSRPLPLLPALLAAAAAALGWLADGTAVYPLLALAIVGLAWRPPPWRTSLAALGLFAVISSPWIFWGNFAGRSADHPPAAESRPSAAGANATTRPSTWATWAAGRRANLDRIGGGSFSQIFDLTSPVRSRRSDEFRHPIRALGILNMVWLLGPVLRLIRRRSPRVSPFAGAIFAWISLSVALGVAFEPAALAAHQESAAPLLVAGSLAAFLLLDLPVWLAVLGLGWHAVYFAATWLPYYGAAPLTPGMFALSLLAIALLLACFRLVRRGPA